MWLNACMWETTVFLLSIFHQNQNIKKWSDLEGFKCQKWGKNSKKCLIPIFGFQGEAINTEGLLKVLYFMSGL